MTVPGHTALRAFLAIDKLRIDRGLRLGDGAALSPCWRYRYLLWRIWEPSLPIWSFGMLNPSTADHLTLDATVTRCCTRAQNGGAGGLVVWNLFAWRETDPAAMKRATEPVGPENDRAIRVALENSALNIAAWGAHGTHLGREAAVRQMLAEAQTPLHTLAFTKDGHPRHPLYLPANLEPQPWEYRV
ncbi:DUF1643 domain-containing protein [Tsuneonella suprasediminis]|uniref:DUF1643 domain-containing protein n=1 Tax=Tsuneonella suprasediminis TaxID=2306996 RepID=UPI002F95B53B